MTDTIVRVTLHGPLVAVTGYGLTEAEARHYAEQAVAAQVAQIERDIEQRKKKSRERNRQHSIEIPY